MSVGTEGLKSSNPHVTNWLNAGDFTVHFHLLLSKIQLFFVFRK